jgi:cytochrome c oxidase accessory protein FixG
MSEPSTITAPERVLSTLNRDGTRRWLRPRVSPGRFLRWRRVVAWLLIALFTALPWIKVGGLQSVLIDVPARRLTFFGALFLPTDTLLLMLLLAGIFVLIFLVTALFGRLWCGWACPQTVYMEFVYRPLERLFDGAPGSRRRGGPAAGGVRTVLKYAVYLLVSLLLAHTFLAYFVGVERLFAWMQHSPFEHPTAFLVMAATTGLMMFDFCFFREQTCIVACPYGRLQSVLLDRHSLIIGYDRRRGEPRGRLRRSAAGNGEAAPKGDCVDCHLCVVTCPTGIDIRDGLQMECVGCAQCIDACDAVMDRIGRPRGLIRYTSGSAMERGRWRLLRPRVILYPLLLLAISVTFGMVLAARAPADVTLLRGGGRPYAKLPSGEIQNDLRIKIVNRTREPRRYEIGVTGIDGARIHAAEPSVLIEGGADLIVPASIVVPPGSFELGRATIEVTVRDDQGFEDSLSYRLQGPLS